jgi:hypothetical protein
MRVKHAAARLHARETLKTLALPRIAAEPGRRQRNVQGKAARPGARKTTEDLRHDRKKTAP